MVQPDDFSRRLWTWLQRAGFTDDPFAVFEGDRERQLIQYLFVDRSYLHDVLGNPSYPQVAFLFAGRGEGKTSTREMVAYECAHARFRGQALAVRYIDFNYILEKAGNNPGSVTSRHHVDAICRQIIKTLAEDVPSTYFDFLEVIERNILMGYVNNFADPVTQIRLAKILNCEAVEFDWEKLSVHETLKTMVDLVCQIGQSRENRYRSVYILVDRVDETEFGLDGAIGMLRPLLSDSALLEAQHLAFKFFLPITVWDELRSVVAIRPDRAVIKTIKWDPLFLEKMIDQRLSYYSAERVTKLGGLCTLSAKNKVFPKLLEVSGGSPRTLLRLCHELIYHHIANSNEPLIDISTVWQTVSNFEHLRLSESSNSSVTQSARASASVPVTGLYMDDGGHVWIDGKTLEPPLSNQLFLLLGAMYKHAPEIVPNVELMEAVWPSQLGSGDEQNLRKLVTRLRERIEPNVKEPRFIQNIKGRGYWLKID